MVSFPPFYWETLESKETLTGIYARLPDLANKNTGCLAKFGLQMNNEYLFFLNYI